MKHHIAQKTCLLFAVVIVGVIAMACDTRSDSNSTTANLTLERLVAIGAGGEESESLELDLSGGVRDAKGLAVLVNPADAGASDQVVILTRCRVSWVRDDGKAQAGVDVPFPFEAPLEVAVGPSQRIPVELILILARAMSVPPLASMHKGDAKDIRGTITVTLLGRDLMGRTVSVTGSIPAHAFNNGRRPATY